MATIIPVVSDVTGGESAVLQIYWANLEAGDDGAPVDASRFADKTVGFYGVFGGGTAKLQGSMFPDTGWVNLTDANGTPIERTEEGLALVLENPRYIRPVIDSGDGTTEISVVLVAKSVQPMRV